MSTNEDKLLKIEQSILNKIEKSVNKTDKTLNVQLGGKKGIHISKNKDKKVNISGGKIHITSGSGGSGTKTIHIGKKKMKENMTPEQLYHYKKNKIKADFRGHLTAYLMVHALLVFISLVSGSFWSLWFMYPAFGWGIGLASHYVSNKHKEKEIDILYGNQGVDTSKKTSEVFGPNRKQQRQIGQASSSNGLDNIENYEGVLDEPYASYVKEAHELSSSLLNQINDSKNVDENIIKEIRTSISHYTEKINFLAKKGYFLGKAIQYFEENDPEESKEYMQKELETKNLDISSKTEYENAMRMLDKQIESLIKLRTVADNIEAKMKTALITLRTLQLNFIRLQYVTEESASTAISSLNKKTEEIDEYIDLLSDSLKDIDNQI